jgi:hypothetical protein
VAETTAIIGRLLVRRKSVMNMQLTMMLIAAIVRPPNPISFTDTPMTDADDRIDDDFAPLMRLRCACSVCVAVWGSDSAGD